MTFEEYVGPQGATCVRPITKIALWDHIDSTIPGANITLTEFQHRVVMLLSCHNVNRVEIARLNGQIDVIELHSGPSGEVDYSDLL